MVSIVKEVSDEEMKEVFFSLKDNKAPGPDGFNALFFKRAWCIVCWCDQGHQVLFPVWQVIERAQYHCNSSYP